MLREEEVSDLGGDPLLLSKAVFILLRWRIPQTAQHRSGNFCSVKQGTLAHDCKYHRWGPNEAYMLTADEGG